MIVSRVINIPLKSRFPKDTLSPPNVLSYVIAEASTVKSSLGGKGFLVSKLGRYAACKPEVQNEINRYSLNFVLEVEG